MRLYIIRHGKTPMNEEKRYIGRTDQSLSENGVKELREKREIIDYPVPEKLFVSPMKRARESADILFEGVSQYPVEDLREIDFGEFEGLNYDELKDNPKYREWIDSLGTAAPPGGETTEGYRARVRRGLEQVLKGSVGLNDVVLLCHGGILMSIMTEYTGCNYYDNLSNCGEGVAVNVDFTVKEDGNVSISRFELDHRITA